MQRVQLESDNIVFVSSLEVRSTEQHFATSTLLQETDLENNNHLNTRPGYNKLGDVDLRFDGSRAETSANRASVMKRSQKQACCQTFNLYSTIKSTANPIVRRIGGFSNSLGSVIIQVPSKLLELVTDVQFLFIKIDHPTKLSMNEIVGNGLDILIQGRSVSLGELRHTLLVKNYFLVHR